MKYTKAFASGILTILICLSSNAMAVPFVFINGTVTDADEVNENFASMFRGDGSAGDIAIDSTNDDWRDVNEIPANPNFANFLIPAGVTLTVPAGTTIRCSGTFTNEGTINVSGGAAHATTGFASTTLSASSGPVTNAHPGDTPRSATTGQFDNNAIAVVKNLLGGLGGSAIPPAVARTSFAQFRIGGGAAGGNTTTNFGGGLIKVYCGGAIVNTGNINATGFSGGPTGGGGGGGIVVLASQASIDNVAGTIDVSGGAGGAANGGFFGSSGGGGGGIVVMISPVAPVVGTEIVTGGAGGAAGTAVTQSRLAGSGGGGSGGNGGNGGSVIGTAANAGAAGGAGYVITMTADPSVLVR